MNAVNKVRWVQWASREPKDPRVLQVQSVRRVSPDSKARPELVVFQVLQGHLESKVKWDHLVFEV